ncbi:MAG: glucosaminidase domain-containing protein [Methanofastidiosum sp.]
MMTITGVAMAIEKPWSDWPDSEVESDLEAGWFVKDNDIFKGYEDGLFHPNTPITSFQFCNVLERAEIEVDRGYFQTPDVFMKDTQKFMPNTAWSSKPDEPATRFRTAVMIYRYKQEIPAPVEPDNPPTQDDIVAERIEQLFQDKPVTWNGVKRYSKLVGMAHIIVEDARKYNVPIWLCLGQGWWETQWYTTGMSLTYNQGWGIKDSQHRWGEYKGTHAGFTDYITVEESIHAYFRLMSSPEMPYRAWIDQMQAGDESKLRTILQSYCVNSISSHLATVKTVRGWCEERGIE